MILISEILTQDTFHLCRYTDFMEEDLTKDLVIGNSIIGYLNTGCPTIEDEYHRLYITFIIL